MKNTNPKNTVSWKNLFKHYKKVKKYHIKDLFLKDINRFKNFSLCFKKKILIDFSKNRITQNTIKKLLSLANEMDLKNAIRSMYFGKKINKTENRAVLHVALRNLKSNFYVLKNLKIKFSIKKMLKKIKIFSESIINKKWLGYTGKYITDIVNIGIGGSHLGPLMVSKALTPFKNRLKLHFLSNIDGTNIKELLKKVKIDQTLFIICSKTFTTQETLTNAKIIKKIFLKHAILKKNMKYHFIGISENEKKVLKFGIEKKNFFKLWNWVGGRYSLWSAAGLSIVLSIGFKNFLLLLKGASDMDKHFLKTPFKKNIPVLLALISIWYNNFFKSETEAVIVYDEYLSHFYEYLQQSSMESNGKNIDRNMNLVNWQTGSIIWGSTGTNCQHSFFQLLHQGTKLIPCDFIVPIKTYNSVFNSDHHLKLLSNFFAQTKALSFGNNNIKNFKNKKEVNSNKIFKNCFGNQPNNSFLITEINPYNLGSLIALYEHKIFCQGVILNIFSFDQWGVEYGKKISVEILKVLKNKYKCKNYDNSTNSLINFFKKFK
ncbi:glucose-6-phosphate isomerase [Buchnera aphidicola]|uniref:glucose-6-phosphate isomerase n=1 Tax=Buchnera aphidicola TaxID=9 RepID=UPI0030EE2778